VRRRWSSSSRIGSSRWAAALRSMPQKLCGSNMNTRTLRLRICARSSACRSCARRHTSAPFPLLPAPQRKWPRSPSSPIIRRASSTRSLTSRLPRMSPSLTRTLPRRCRRSSLRTLVWMLWPMRLKRMFPPQTAYFTDPLAIHAIEMIMKDLIPSY
jgi:Iron-containing alcohol dehydrogenase